MWGRAWVHPGGLGVWTPVFTWHRTPAPVPPQVAIPRPTPAELEQTNAALKRLIDNDKSKDQALLKNSVADAAAAAAPQHGCDVHANASATGPRHEGSPHRKAGQHLIWLPW